MKKTVQLKKINRPNEIVVLDIERGTVSPKQDATTDICGNYTDFEGQEFGVFALNGALYFQWNNRRWNFQGLGPKVKYEHNFQRKTTSFSIDGESIEYPAWWVGDPTFDPNLPERDEDEDFLAYISNLARNDGLQKILIQTWDK